MGNGLLHAGACFHYCVQNKSVPEQCSNTTKVGEDIVLCQGQQNQDFGGTGPQDRLRSFEHESSRGDD